MKLSTVKEEGYCYTLVMILNVLRLINLINLNASRYGLNYKNTQGASLTLGVCYRSQSAAYSEIREMFTAIGQASKGRCLIVGDCNYPTINWVINYLKVIIKMRRSY